MVLFLVPAVLAVLDHRELLSLVGLIIFRVVLCSTRAVMGVIGQTSPRLSKPVVFGELIVRLEYPETSGRLQDADECDRCHPGVSRTE
ncbi:hypothetical protein [Bradyrhizobium sp. CCBAU 051011]|uniref:hypothetical protein n=1 Tax=Bradyrhizobium sp. CCBAU 051011 TaxID=858422 RepID=UPI00137A44F3|nr:hypothetical protein [Bradyrhizobium sp. CCBAU 051011]